MEIASEPMGSRFSSDVRAAILQRFYLSGVSLAAFCRQEGLAYQSVRAWRKALRGDGRLNGRSAAGPEFLEVVCGEASRGSTEASLLSRAFGVNPPGPGPVVQAGSGLIAELSLPGGFCLRVFSGQAAPAMAAAAPAAATSKINPDFRAR